MIKRCYNRVGIFMVYLVVYLCLRSCTCWPRQSPAEWPNSAAALHGSHPCLVLSASSHQHMTCQLFERSLPHHTQTNTWRPWCWQDEEIHRSQIGGGQIGHLPQGPSRSLLHQSRCRLYLHIDQSYLVKTDQAYPWAFKVNTLLLHIGHRLHVWAVMEGAIAELGVGGGEVVSCGVSDDKSIGQW